MATHLNILAWKIPWVRGFFVALMGYNAWDHKESDTTGHAHTPSKMTGVFMKRGEDGDIRGEGGHVVMEAEIGVGCLQAKGCQGPLANYRS